MRVDGGLTGRQDRERQFWDQHAQSLSAWREFPYASWGQSKPAMRLATDYLGPIDGKRVLICGVGAEAILFARAGAIVCGFDISEGQVSAVRELADRLGLKARIKLDVTTFERLPYEGASFDLAYGAGILHHVDLIESAKQLARVLVPSGRASFVEPLGMNPGLQFARQHLPYRGKSRTEDERPVTYSDITRFGDVFAKFEYREVGLVGMLRRRVITNRDLLRRIDRVDDHLLRGFPPLRRLCSEVWIGVETQGDGTTNEAEVRPRA